MSQEWHCPVCNNRIDATFGMVQCSQCQTVLFVDFAGNIIIGGGEEEPAEDSVVDIELPQESYSQVPVTDGNQSFHEQPSNDLGLWNTPPVAEAVPDTQELINEPPSSDFQPLLETLSPETEALDEGLSSNPSWEAEPFSTEIKNEDPVVSASGSEKAGTGLFQINIEGIDSADLRKNVLASLLDHRLGLVNDEIAESIVEGQLSVRGLNAVKASCIINSLKALPIELKWQVYADGEADSKKSAL